MTASSEREGSIDSRHDRDMMALIRSVLVTGALHGVAKLRFADILGDDAKSADEVAKAAETHPGATYRMLRALASYGVFEEDASQRFRLTPLGQTLRSDRPGSLRALAEFTGAKTMLSSVDFTHILKTGTNSFEAIHGVPAFQYMRAKEPALGALFQRAMGDRAALEYAELRPVYDFASAQHVVDVGAGNGTFLAALLRDNPSLTATLFDQEAVVEQARGRMPAALAPRVSFVAGDFFEFVPTGGDLYVIMHCLHNWDRDRAVTILTNIRKAMKPGSRLAIMDMLVEPGNGSDLSKLLDLAMMVIYSQGSERTEDEVRSIVGAAGLAVTRIVTSADMRPNHIIEAIAS